MVYGAINEKGESWYTKMSRVFAGIRNRQKDLNWLVTDMDCVPQVVWQRADNEDYCWITGEEWDDILAQEDTQWVWAVLSGFDKHIPLSSVLRHPLPYANNNEELWSMPLTIQHPLASIEIVCWDSSCTLLFSRDREAVDDFLAFFPDSESLSRYNENK